MIESQSGDQRSVMFGKGKEKREREVWSMSFLPLVIGILGYILNSFLTLVKSGGSSVYPSPRTPVRPREKVLTPRIGGNSILEDIVRLCSTLFNVCVY